MLAAILQHITGGEQVVLEQLAAAALARDAGENARVRRGINHPVALGESGEIAGGAQVRVSEAYAKLFQAHAIRLRTGAAKIIKAVELDAFDPLAKGFRQTGTNEAADARDQQLHEDATDTERRCIQLEEISSKMVGSVLV